MGTIAKSIIKDLSGKIKRAGFKVYLAESGEYGFYTDGERVVSFQCDFGNIQYSGNYRSQHCGTGWQLDDGLSYSEMLNAKPPYWATNGEKVTLTTPEQHLDFYGKSSKFKEVEA